jgi:hypothetical protein
MPSSKSRCASDSGQERSGRKHRDILLQRKAKVEKTVLNSRREPAEWLVFALKRPGNTFQEAASKCHPVY